MFLENSRKSTFFRENSLFLPENSRPGPVVNCFLMRIAGSQPKSQYLEKSLFLPESSRFQLTVNSSMRIPESQLFLFWKLMQINRCFPKILFSGLFPMKIPFSPGKFLIPADRQLILDENSGESTVSVLQIQENHPIFLTKIPTVSCFSQNIPQQSPVDSKVLDSPQVFSNF